MIRRFAVSAALSAAAAAVLTGAATAGPLALASMDTPLAAGGHVSVTAAAPKKCAGNFVTGTIGGQQKCLAAGQQCQQAHTADYTKYGFTCKKVGTRYQLSKNGTQPKPGAKPKPH